MRITDDKVKISRIKSYYENVSRSNNDPSEIFPFPYALRGSSVHNRKFESLMIKEKILRFVGFVWQEKSF